MLTTLRTQAPEVTDVRTRLALLGTIGHLHAEPLRYDLRRLRQVVEEIEPDLLGVEVDPRAWANGDLCLSPLEVREALVPASRLTDTVIVPLGGGPACEFAVPYEGLAAGLRSAIVRGMDRFLMALQRRVDGPDDMAKTHFKHVCEVVCAIEAAASTQVSRLAWEQSNAEILENLLAAARRDPGRRVLVAVQCRRLHWLEQRLRDQDDEMELVPLDRL